MVRGIFSTALTFLLSQNNFTIVRPSSATSTRFNLPPKYEATGVTITDREDRQGIYLAGEADQADSVVQLLRNVLPDVIVRDMTFDLSILHDRGRIQVHPGQAVYDLEFPSGSKVALDSLRSKVSPTVDGHHQLKSVASDRVEEAESLLADSPESRPEISRHLREDLVYRQYQPGRSVQIEHIKPMGELVNLAEGKILGFAKSTLVMKRVFSGGRFLYDGLGVYKEEGDYAITEAEENSWVLEHRYYSDDGRLKGELHNVNTPIELYPGRIRYVDLEVDVVKPAEGSPRIIDVDRLDEAVEKGYVSESLAAKAIAVARETEALLRRSGQ